MVPLRFRAAAFVSVAAIALFAQDASAQQPPSAPATGTSAPLDPDAPMAPLPDLDADVPDPTPPPPAAAPAATRAPDAAAGGRYRLALNGLDGVDASVRTRFTQLSTLIAGESKPANAAQIDRRAREDEATLREALRAAGYYSAELTSEIRGGDPVTVAFDVTPGPLYRFDSVALRGMPTGPAGTALANDFALHAGDPVAADKVAAAIADLRLGLGRRGFPFAKVADPQIVVDHESNKAAFTLPIDAGGQERFGRITVSGDRPIFSPRHVGVIARFRPGDPYDSALTEDLRRALINTGLVSVAIVAPKPTADPRVADIDVHIERAPPRTIAGEFGYGTGEGIRAEASWQHRNLLPPEGSVTFRGILGTREQSLSATLRRGNFRARDHVLTAQVAADHSNFDAYDAKTLSLSAGIERQTNIIWQKTWSWSLGGEFLASDERDTIEATGEPRRRTFLVIAAPGVLAYDNSDDLLNPTRGFRLAGRLSPEASLRQGFQGYVKAQIDASAYRPLGRRLVIAGRIRLAAINGAPRDDIAPSRRLYAGGGGSVRGFGYQKIGPVDANGDPVGGRGLAEAAIEARIRFGNFGIVPFFDAGHLSTAPIPKFTNLRYGTGLGARYYTSFGPIRLDLGTPIARRKGESKVAIYVSLGQAF